MRSRLAAVFAFFLGSHFVLLARPWETLEHCEYSEGAHSDGDSIEVRPNGKHYIFRLYFVDCVEKNPLSAVRRRGQARYFGLTGSETTALRAAYLARNFTRDKLREPFTVYTRWQRVDPDGDNPAVRAFIETVEGEDVATLLVREGLAIIRHGETAVSDHPQGRSSRQIALDLRQAELDAKAHKHGIWGLANGSEDGQTQQVRWQQIVRHSSRAQAKERRCAAGSVVSAQWPMEQSPSSILSETTAKALLGLSSGEPVGGSWSASQRDSREPLAGRML
jgi:endonuclease YncB( thermonuclease family)